MLWQRRCHSWLRERVAGLPGACTAQATGKNEQLAVPPVHTSLSLPSVMFTKKWLPKEQVFTLFLSTHALGPTPVPVYQGMSQTHILLLCVFLKQEGLGFIFIAAFFFFLSTRHFLVFKSVSQMCSCPSSLDLQVERGKALLAQTGATKAGGDGLSPFPFSHVLTSLLLPPFSSLLPWAFMVYPWVSLRVI